MTKNRSQSSIPPEPLVFLVDRSLGRGVARALQEAGADVRYHDDYFAQAARDEEWLTHAGQLHWVVLTKDKGIRHRQVERDALIAANVRAFVLASGGRLRGQEMNEILVSRLSEMESFARDHAPPFIAGVSRSGIRLYQLR